jgi:hypothetical protein
MNFLHLNFFFKIWRSNMVNGTFWKISEISTSDLANSYYGCSPHEKIAKKYWLRLSMNKNFPYSHTTSLSCKPIKNICTKHKPSMCILNILKKKHQTFFYVHRTQKETKIRDLNSDLIKCTTIFSHIKNSFVKRSFSHSQCSNRNNMM